ncbi:lysosomal alpha-mannosidase-like [Anneissia japonica]|uniref:lysosomal alpha-mannosidase-like n=1 Tax=Anneissia japonica TaxID=1529436 RepID=UPI0014259DEF|nr:lysosomal alpha-mannosidase-like [Anneissia japonica]
MSARDKAYYKMITNVGLVIILSMITVQCAAKCGYQSCTGTKQGVVNVHLVPHTHDDVGWLKTVDEYYYGANNSIQHAGVQYILDSVVSELQRDPDKRFIYVEVAFFERWWNEQTVSTKNVVKNLVNEGRLMFINGGWCMNDEATPHYNAIIDQMTLGLRFLNDNFGTCGRPLIAWHIDPFGHSREQSSLFAQMSFDGFFFARIDYADQSEREKTKTMEGVWKSSVNLGSAADMFFGTLYGPLYGPPHGFCFDQGCHDQPIQDDKNLFDYNVDQRVKDFVAAVQDQASHYKTNHIMMTMGSDFQYENANAWFKNLDKLIKYVNAKTNSTNIHLLYSNPSCYVKSLNDAGVTWETKSDDFFPYGDAPHNYWSGYFTSRPSIKGYVRESNNILQICKQLEILGKSKASSDILKRAMAVAQHHDAVSGTEKQHVANDYAKRLAIGRASCQELIGTTITSVVTDKATVNQAQYCEYMNISICGITESEKQFIVTIYNPIARPVNSYASIAVDGSAYAVTDNNMTSIKSQLFDVTAETKRVRGSRKGSSKVLVFPYTVPALGLSTYHVSAQNHLTAMQTKGVSKYTMAQMPNSGDIIISNKILSVTFDGVSGILKSMANVAQNMSLKVNQSFYWYNASTGNDVSGQVSGAYIFRPNKTTPIPLFNGKSVSLTVIKGEIVQEVHQQFQPWLSQVVRLREGQDYAEFEWTVGPIPINDGFGKEIISRFDSEIESSNVFYTDANGRQMIKRKLNHRDTWTYNNTEPVAGNYYPVNSRIYIKDTRSQLTVLTDRSQGGSSLTNGSLELMVHRRLLYDDYRGVGEPLNETGQFGDGLMVRGKHCVQLSKPSVAGKMHRSLGERLYMAPIVMFIPAGADGLKEPRLKDSMLEHPLPENVHLLTLEKWSDDTVLLRLEHQYEKTDDADLSKNVTVSLKGLFVTFDIQSVQEVTLSANQVLSEAKRLQWNTANGFVPTDSKPPPVSPVTLDVTLTPMQIRTFLAKVKMH